MCRQEAVSCAEPYAYATRFLRRLDTSFKGSPPELPRIDAGDEDQAGDVTPVASFPNEAALELQPNGA